MSGKSRKRRPCSWDGAPRNNFSLAAEINRSAAAATLAGAVDLALATGDVVVIEGTRIALVPDTLIVEMIANGEQIEPVPQVWRDDGRTCNMYRAPDEVLS